MAFAGICTMCVRLRGTGVHPAQFLPRAGASRELEAARCCVTASAGHRFLKTSTSVRTSHNCATYHNGEKATLKLLARRSSSCSAGAVRRVFSSSPSGTTSGLFRGAPSDRHLAAMRGTRAAACQLSTTSCGPRAEPLLGRPAVATRLAPEFTPGEGAEVAGSSRDGENEREEEKNGWEAESEGERELAGVNVSQRFAALLKGGSSRGHEEAAEESRPIPPGRARAKKGKVAVPIHETYDELKLREIEQSKPVRVRQHVNPLQTRFMVPVQPPVWEDVFADPTLPLFVDIGSASGRLALVLAKRNASLSNYLGLEIRDKLVERAQTWAQELRLGNAHFMVANATVALAPLLASYPGALSTVAILCPDPHFKNRHHKRRVVQPFLVNSIIANLPQGGQIFLQSDVKEVILDMQQQFESLGEGLIGRAPQHSEADKVDEEGYLLDNPLGVPTEREMAVLMHKDPMYRLLYVRQ